MNTGTGISGSTAWHNKVRARAYMKAMETERGDEPDPDAKSIQFLKNNYGRQGDTLLVRWQRGVYVLESAPNSLERLAEDQKVDFRFLQLLNHSMNRAATSATRRRRTPTPLRSSRGKKTATESGLVSATSRAPCSVSSRRTKSTSRITDRHRGAAPGSHPARAHRRRAAYEGSQHSDCRTRTTPGMTSDQQAQQGDPPRKPRERAEVLKGLSRDYLSICLMAL